MRAERFGSYSIAATLAGTPSLTRLKSMMRYWRLWPPPWWRVVMRPLLLRPPVLLSGSTSDFSGAFLVTSSNEETAMKRRPGLVGLYFLTAIRLGPPRRSRSGGPRGDARWPSSSPGAYRRRRRGA